MLDDILDYPEEEILPTGFSHSVVNASSSYVGTALKIHGPTFALVGFEDPFYEAADLAHSLLSCGQCRRVLIVGADEKSLIPEAAEKLRKSSIPLRKEGGCALLLASAPDENRFGSLVLSGTDGGERVLPCGIPSDFPKRIKEASPDKTVILNRLPAPEWIME